MAKTKAAKRKSSTTWTGADHSDRTAKRIASLQKKQRKKQQKLEASTNHDTHHHEPESKRGRLSSHVPSDTYKRTHLAHDNEYKIELSKLRLATSQIQRQLTALQTRLENWDPSDPTNDVILQNGKVVGIDNEKICKRMELDRQNRRMDYEAREKAKGEQMLIEAEKGVNPSVGRRKANLRKKPRPGPETWKLRGAARPAWEVYDFDTRYVDPHIKALEDHREKLKRSVNIFHLCRGRFAQDHTHTENDDTINENGPYPPPQPHCRTYLSLLTQLGSLHLTRKNYSSARSSFLSAIELEGYTHPISITNARTQLMNMYLSTNRPSSARKLWNLLPNDCSAWIRYSAALIEYVSWNILQEDGSTQSLAEMALADAIRGNVFVVFLLGWKEMFDRAMEYTADVVEWGDGEAGSIMEAVEYYGCGVNVMDEDEKGLSMWLGTEGSLEWVRSFVLKVLNDSVNEEYSDLRSTLIGWEALLAREEDAFEHYKKSNQINNEAESDGIIDNEEDEPDLLMYAGMFRTAMDWLQDAGEFMKSPTNHYIQDIVHNDVKDETAAPKISCTSKNQAHISSAESDDSSNSNDNSDDDESSG